MIHLNINHPQGVLMTEMDTGTMIRGTMGIGTGIMVRTEVEVLTEVTTEIIINAGEKRGVPHIVEITKSRIPLRDSWTESTRWQK